MVHNRKILKMPINKRSKRNSNKKKQDRIITTVTATNDNLSILYDICHNIVKINDAKIESMHHETFCERDSGKDKIISQTPCEEDKGYLNHFESLVNNIDFLFAVDTNTVEINKERISFSACFFTPKPLSADENIIRFLPFIAFEINDINLNVNPECIGWYLLINCIVSQKAYNFNQRIGIAVDSELGKLKNINSLKEPYYNKYYLPEKIQLLYASDKGKKYLANEMISCCHKAAKGIEEFYRKNDIKSNIQENGDCNFRGFRQIKLKAM